MAYSWLRENVEFRIILSVIIFDTNQVVHLSTVRLKHKKELEKTGRISALIPA
jgi:hypothetical protein